MGATTRQWRPVRWSSSNCTATGTPAPIAQYQLCPGLSGGCRQKDPRHGSDCSGAQTCATAATRSIGGDDGIRTRDPFVANVSGHAHKGLQGKGSQPRNPEQPWITFIAPSRHIAGVWYGDTMFYGQAVAIERASFALVESVAIMQEDPNGSGLPERKVGSLLSNALGKHALTYVNVPISEVIKPDSNVTELDSKP